MLRTLEPFFLRFGKHLLSKFEVFSAGLERIFKWTVRKSFQITSTSLIRHWQQSLCSWVLLHDCPFLVCVHKNSCNVNFGANCRGLILFQHAMWPIFEHISWDYPTSWGDTWFVSNIGIPGLKRLYQHRRCSSCRTSSPKFVSCKCYSFKSLIWSYNIPKEMDQKASGKCGK